MFSSCWLCFRVVDYLFDLLTIFSSCWLCFRLVEYLFELWLCLRVVDYLCELWLWGGHWVHFNLKKHDKTNKEPCEKDDCIWNEVFLFDFTWISHHRTRIHTIFISYPLYVHDRWWGCIEMKWKNEEESLLTYVKNNFFVFSTIWNVGEYVIVNILK